MDLVNSAQLLGGFGEFFGAIAVLITLIYLAAQVESAKAPWHELAEQSPAFSES